MYLHKIGNAEYVLTENFADGLTDCEVPTGYLRFSFSFRIRKSVRLSTQPCRTTDFHSIFEFTPHNKHSVITVTVQKVQRKLVNPSQQ